MDFQPAPPPPPKHETEAGNVNVSQISNPVLQAPSTGGGNTQSALEAVRGNRDQFAHAAMMQGQGFGATGSTSAAEHLRQITAEDSPLNRQAQTQGLQRANQRGLLNSSMAVGAAQDAVLSNAMPLATQDAGFQQTLAQQNQAHRQTLTQQEQAHQNTLDQNEHNHLNVMNQKRADAKSNAWGVMAQSQAQSARDSQRAIQEIQQNSDISAADKTKMIQQTINMRNSDLEFQNSLYTNFSNHLRSSDVFPSL